MKRALVFILVCAFCVALFSVSAFADEPIATSVSVNSAFLAYLKAIGFNISNTSFTTSGLNDWVGNSLSDYGINDTSPLAEGISYIDNQIKIKSGVVATFAGLAQRLFDDLFTSEGVQVNTSVPMNKFNFIVPSVGAHYSSVIYGYKSSGYYHYYRFSFYGIEASVDGVSWVWDTNFSSWLTSTGYIPNYFIFVNTASNFQLWGVKYNGGPVEYLTYTAGPDLTYFSVPSNAPADLSVSPDFVIPEKHLEGTDDISITSPSFTGVSAEDVSDVILSDVTSNDFTAQLETTITRPIVDTIQGLFDAISNFWQELLDWIRNFWDNFVLSIENAIDGLLEGIKGFFNREDGFIADFGDKLQGLSFSSIWHYVTAWLGSISAFLSVVLTIWGNLPYSFSVIVWAGLALTIIFGVFRKFIK